MEHIAIIMIVAVMAGFVVYFVGRRPKQNDSYLLFQQQLESIREQMRKSLDGNSQIVVQQLSELAKQLETQLHHNTGSVAETRKSMDERLDNAARVIGDLHKLMGRFHESLAPIGEIRDILKAPKLRGGFGEVMLEKLLEEMLTAKFFTAQYSFKNGDRVDAVIDIGGQLVPIDSKFPLEKYQEYLGASTDEGKKAAFKGLMSATKKHISDVAKYIRPEEGTYPFALMYVPSENIYYELFVGSCSEETLWPHASKYRVFPVSSNTLYIYLQTISFGLKGMKIAEHAHELLNKVEHLQKDVGDIKRNFEKIGTHLKNAQSAYSDTDKRIDKFEVRFSSLGTEATPELEKPAPAEKETSELVQ